MRKKVIDNDLARSNASTCRIFLAIFPDSSELIIEEDVDAEDVIEVVEIGVIFDDNVQP